DVAEFERGIANPSRIEHASGAVDDDAESSEAAAPFESREQVGSELERFDRHAQDELPGMQRERLVGADLDFAHDLIDVHAFAQVDVGEAAVLEHTKLGAEPEIDRAAAELRVQIDHRRDAYFAVFEVRSDVAIGKNHQNPRGIL